MAGIGAEARLVDDRLRMLDAVADRERLGLHVDAAGVQHREGVARAVTERDDDMVGADLLARGQRHAAHLALAIGAGLDQQVGDLLLEADLAAQALDLGPDLDDHAHQAEGADVRLADVEDLLGRAGLDELRQHLAGEEARVGDLAVELAVGEGAGATLAELDIRFGVQDALAPQAPGVLGPFADLLAALQHDRPQAHLGQDQRDEDAAGAKADDHRTRPLAGVEVGRRMADELVAGVRRRLDVGVAAVALQQRGLGGGVADLAVDGIDQDHRGLLARVIAALEDGEGAELRVGDAEPLQDGGAQGLLGVVEGQAEFVDADHGD